MDKKLVKNQIYSGENNLFPVFLKLEQLKLLIVGGRNVAIEKLNAVLHNAPQTHITIVAEQIADELLQRVHQVSTIQLHQRSYQIDDLSNIDIVITAVNNMVLSEQIKKDANTRGILVNTADKPELCDFYLASIVQKGNLKIAISTNGKSPTLAKRLKEVLFEVIPNDINITLDNLNVIRNGLKADFSYKVDKLNEITQSFLTSQKSIKSEPKDCEARMKTIVHKLVLNKEVGRLIILSHLKNKLTVIFQNKIQRIGYFIASFRDYYGYACFFLLLIVILLLVLLFIRF